MPDPKEITQIKKALKKYEESEQTLISLAKTQFTPSLCPLHPYHYKLSEKLFGQGHYRWTCGFCGTVEEE